MMLDLRFRGAATADGRSWSTQEVLTVTGSSLMAGGLAMGIVALNRDAEVGRYTTKRESGYPIQSLIDERDDAALAADSLLILGGVTLTSALLWRWFGDDE